MKELTGGLSHVRVAVIGWFVELTVAHLPDGRNDQDLQLARDGLRCIRGLPETNDEWHAVSVDQIDCG